MKKVLLPLLAIAIVGVVGCQKEGCTDETATNYDADAKKDDGSCVFEDHDHVHIHFEQPTNGQKIALANAQMVPIHIHFESEAELHDIEIELHPEGDESNLIIAFDNHVHANEYMFIDTVDLSGFDIGDEFHLGASVCTDHDCEEPETADIHFELE